MLDSFGGRSRQALLNCSRIVIIIVTQMRVINDNLRKHTTVLPVA